MVKNKKGKSRKDEPGVQDDNRIVPHCGIRFFSGRSGSSRDLFQERSIRSRTWRTVLITHLEPHHPSLLAEIVSKVATMEAVQAENDMVVKKNKIYVIPPGKDMIMTQGTVASLRPRYRARAVPADRSVPSVPGRGPERERGRGHPLGERFGRVLRYKGHPRRTWHGHGAEPRDGQV